MWGRAIYFAKKASYSNFYAYNSNNGGIKSMILAQVVIGEFVEL